MMDVEPALGAAADAELDYVELIMDGEHAHDSLDVGGLRDGLATHGLDLAVHLPFAGLDLGSQYGAVREASCRTTEASVERAAAAGADVAVAHATSAAWEPAWESAEVVDALAASMDRLAAHGRSHGVEVCFENQPGGHVTVDEFPALVEATDASLTLDTGHARMDGYDAGDQARFLREHGDRVRHLHVHDSRRPANEHLPYGAGNFDFDPLFEALATRDWPGTLSLELFSPDYGYVATSADRLHADLEAAG